MSTDVLIVDAQQTLRARIRDVTIDSKGQITKTLLDLTGLTVNIHWKLAGGATVTKSMVPEPDQVTNKGEATYKIADSDLTGEGQLKAAVEVVDGADNYISLNATSFQVKDLAGTLLT